jgi:lipopolysaccharide/colanic/teichoic acid biosynthesis glycosyltransferase
LTLHQPALDFPAAHDPVWQAEFLFDLGRRHDHPFSVVVVTIAAPATGRRGWDQSLALEELVAEELRRTDLVVRWGGPDRYVVFCPNTSTTGAAQMVQRLEAARREAPIRIGSATFRVDGLSLDALVDAARAKAESGESVVSRTPDGDRHLDVIRRRVRYPLSPTPARRMALRAKRAFDVGVVVLTAPAWLTVLGFVAGLIKISEPTAPVLFVQERTGRAGRRFGMLKFRTMVPNAEELKSDLEHLSLLQWPDFKLDRDPRITRIGAILRKTSLDELPQMWNVLRGDMSLVGPRPTSFSPDTYEGWQTARLDAVPGVTGLWQVEGRGSTEFDERIRLDLEYIERQGFFYDLWLLLRTVVAVFQRRGSR